MSTNFFFIDFETAKLEEKIQKLRRDKLLTDREAERLMVKSEEDESSRFIGKRSAAGLYCWDCGITLCVDGEARIHFGHGAGHFLDACPKCHKKPADEGLQEGNPAGVELGFSKPRNERPKGVRGCSSFTWHITKEEMGTRFVKIGLDVVSIIDEYDRKMTGREFLAMIASNCPVNYVDTSNGWS